MRRKLINALLRVLYFILIRLEVSGKENVPPTGPLILMINHIDALDPFIVVGIFPRSVTPLSKIEVFDIPLIGFLTRVYGAIPIQRGRVDTRALRRSYQVLQEGGVLLIAPEGTRSPTRSLQRAKEGMALIAVRTGASIIPVGITGTEHAGRYWRRLRRVPVRITIGEPFRLEPGAETLRRPLLRAMTDEAMYRLAAILPPTYRGIYGDTDAALQSYVEPLSSGPRPDLAAQGL
ncbi:MAG: lysophospholipid acyltransferase family protein [Anaerolineae bacterium]